MEGASTTSPVSLHLECRGQGTGCVRGDRDSARPSGSSSRPTAHSPRRGGLSCGSWGPGITGSGQARGAPCSSPKHYVWTRDGPEARLSLLPCAGTVGVDGETGAGQAASQTGAVSASVLISATLGSSRAILPAGAAGTLMDPEGRGWPQGSELRVVRPAAGNPGPSLSTGV